jgi:23S rRNA C2498 (ribose-2'-O)-methylase RlmM
MYGVTVNTAKANILVARAGFAPLLSEELADRFGLETRSLGEDAVALDANAKNLPLYDQTIFARQFLPLATPLQAADVGQAALEVLRRLEVTSQRANRQSGRWTLHSFSVDDNAAPPGPGKLEKEVLSLVKQKLPRLWQRYASPADMAGGEQAPSDFVVQIFFETATAAWLSIGSFASGISPYVAGNLRMRARADAPSRSARKIEEAFRELGRLPQIGETAVDLGAAPGGWTYALARRGASVTAVDAADLALPDTKTFRDRVYHVRENGLRFHPPGPVDWLCCDMIVAPHETVKVLSYWLEKKWMKHFIINLKLPKDEPWQSIKAALTLMGQYPWPQMKARHLFHDRWEITLIGSCIAP